MQVRSAVRYRKERFGKTDKAIKPQSEELNLLQTHVCISPTSLLQPLILSTWCLRCLIHSINPAPSPSLFIIFTLFPAGSCHPSSTRSSRVARHLPLLSLTCLPALLLWITINLLKFVHLAESVRLLQPALSVCICVLSKPLSFSFCMFSDIKFIMQFQIYCDATQTFTFNHQQ